MATTLITSAVLADMIGPGGITTIRAADQTLVEMMLNGIVEHVEKYLNRKLEYVAGDVEVIDPTPTGSKIYLSRFPIEEVISIIPMGTDGLFDISDAFESTSYWTDSDNGIIHSLNGWLSQVPHEVTYSGGYYDYLSSASPQLPPGLALPIALQFKWLYERRNNLGMNSQSSADGSANYYETGGLLNSVTDMLAAYKRIWI